MFLESGARIKGYTIQRLLEKNWDYVIYEVVDQLTGQRLMACEHFPSKISERRGEEIVPFKGSEEDYESSQSLFREQGDNLRFLGFPGFIRIKEMIAENNTTYVFYQTPEGEKLSRIMENKGGRLHYSEALRILEPLFGDVCRAYDKKVYMRPRIENIRVSMSAGLESFYVPQYRTDFLIEDMANTFYTAVTGKVYKDYLESPMSVGAAMPPALDKVIYEALYMNAAYNSPGDFLRVLKEAGQSPVIETSRPIHVSMPAGANIKGHYAGPAYNRPYVEPPPQKGGNKLFIGCLGAGCLCIILMIVVGIVLFGIFGMRAARAVNSATVRAFAVPETSSSSTPMPDVEIFIEETESLSIGDTYAFTALNDYNMALNGFLVYDENYVYYRTRTGGQWALVRRGIGSGQEEILVAGAAPAFMQLDGGKLYYADAEDDYHIYYIEGIGEEEPKAPFLVAEIRSAYLQVKNGLIYYSNLGDGGILYRIEENGAGNERVGGSYSEYLAKDGDALYYMSAGNLPELRVLIISGEYGKSEFRTDGPYCDDNVLAVNVTPREGSVYFVDYYTDTLKAAYPDGSLEEVEALGSMYYFQFHGETIYFIDTEGYVKAYDMTSGEYRELNIEAVYFSITEDSIYYFDYNDGELYRAGFYGGTPELVYS